MRDARVETVTSITTENKISTTMQRMVKYNADISVKVKATDTRWLKAGWKSIGWIIVDRVNVI